MPNVGKTRGKTQTQSKLANFGAQSMEQRVSKEATTNMEATSTQSGGELTGAKEEILTAINSLKSEFST